MYFVWHYSGVSILSEFLTFKCMTTDGSLYTRWKPQPTKDYFHILQKPIHSTLDNINDIYRPWHIHLLTKTTPMFSTPYSIASVPTQPFRQKAGHVTTKYRSVRDSTIFTFSIIQPTSMTLSITVKDRHFVCHLWPWQNMIVKGTTTWFKLPFSRYFSVMY